MLLRSPSRIYRNWIVDSRRWDAYRPRSGDIVIATYPKSGTTWMQQIVSLLVFQSTEPRPIAEIAPWFEMKPLQPPPGALMDRLDAQSHRRFIKCHLPFDAIPIYDEVKYVHVARDGRDACLSYHNHCSALGEVILGAMDEIGHADEEIGRSYPRSPDDPRAFFRRWMSEGAAGEGDGSPYGSWFDFERTYWAERSRPNLLLVHYADLKRDLSGEMRRIAAFLDIDVPEAIWPELVEEATFEQMRRVGTRLHPTIARVMIGGTDRFFDKGENGRWHGVLAPEDLTAFRERVERRLDPACAKWLERGRGGTDGARP